MTEQHWKIAAYAVFSFCIAYMAAAIVAMEVIKADIDDMVAKVQVAIESLEGSR